MTHAAGRSAAGRQVEMFGRYRLLGRLAIGGMAEVWAAQLLAAGGFCKNMVIKRMLPELTSQPTFLRMLMQEARVAAKLSHTNICAVFELGEVEGEYYIAMEYLRGCALTQVLRAGGGIEVATAVAIVAQACDGLHYAHEQRDSSGGLLGLVHRDVSPHNLFVTVDGVVKVLDFGIAKVDDGSSDRTEAGKVKGKLPYMSPEQLEAQPLDRRSDVWSLGVVLWELLAGKRLFGGASPAFTVDAIRNARVPALASVGVTAPRLDDVLAKALCRNREWRYATAAELRAAIVEACAVPPSPAPVLSELVWSRSGAQIKTQDALFEDDDADPGVVERLPLRADATQPSYEHVDLLGLGTTALSEVLEVMPGNLDRAAPSDPTRVLAPIIPAIEPGSAEISITPAPRPRRALYLLAALAALALAAALALLVRDPAPAVQGTAGPAPEVQGTAGPTPEVQGTAGPTPEVQGTAGIADAGAPVRIEEVDAATVVVAVVEPKREPKREPRREPKVVPKAAPGKLTIDAKPWATIYVDGKKIGVTPIVVPSIAAGSHTIKAVAEDGTTKTMTVNVEPGGDVRKKVKW